MRAFIKHEKVTISPGESLTQNDLQAYERLLALRFPNIELGYVEYHLDGKWKNKVTVAVKCECGELRHVATSDLQQVVCCERCTIRHRNDRRAAARKRKLNALRNSGPS